jgi:hypothetical protein
LVPRRSACHGKCNRAWSRACALQLPSAKRSRKIAAAKSGRFKSGAVNEADLRGSIIGCFDRTTHRVQPYYATVSIGLSTAFKNAERLSSDFGIILCAFAIGVCPPQARLCLVTEGVI